MRPYWKLLACAALACAGTVFAQAPAYPTKPVTVIVPLSLIHI